jgi:hypothetical protein
MIKDIDDYYFTDEEYDIFAEKYQNANSKYERDIRKEVQTKMLDLNTDILKEISKRKMELYNHSNPKNTTSLIFPCQYNRGKVNWVGVRYGKHPKDIKELNKTVILNRSARDDDPKYAFQKHACMQIDISYNGIDMGIFHAVPQGAIDRSYLHDHINNEDTELLTKIREELSKLKGFGYEWNIWDTNLEGVELPDFGGPNNPEKVYYFDNENNEDFISWYSKNDREGCYSSMLVHFPRYDERIKTDNIVDTSMKIFEQIYPLYKLISWNIHYTGKVEI